MFSREQIMVTLLLLSIVAGTLLLNFVARDVPIAFLVFPAVVLVTFQRGFAGGFIGLLMAAAYFMIPVLVKDSHGALKPLSVREQIIVVQVFIAVIGFTVVLVGAALAGGRRRGRGRAAAGGRAGAARE